MPKLVLWFDQISLDDVALVGGKTASLGEMIRELTAEGVRVPQGFAITAEAYRHFIKSSDIERQLKGLLRGLDTRDVEDLRRRGKAIRETILKAEFPADLEAAILEAYYQMGERFGYGKEPDVAVRSSATAEDLADASFAGQQETYLNVRGHEQLLESVKKCFASLFTDRAISYREDKGFSHLGVALCVAVQKMVRSDAACSGVMFTLDTESGFKDVVLINASWGLGEAIVKGLVNPDEYYVFKPTLLRGKRPIIGKKLGEKRLKVVYAKQGVATTQTTSFEQENFCLSDEEILQLARWGCAIEEHYSKRRKKWTPMDIEWAKDGDGKSVGSGELFIVQARPETVHALRDFGVYERYELLERGKVLISGQAIGEKINQGKANVILSPKEMHLFKEGEILVTDMTDPDWEPIMKKAAAIVTNRGGRTSHAAIVSREFGIPCVIGTGNATEVLKTGQEVTVCCAEGEVGRVYEGKLKFRVKRIDATKLPKTRTKIMMNVGIPERAFIEAQIPNDGVGLAREEFIISSYIGIHPLALLRFEELKEKAKADPKVAEVVREIEKRTRGYEDKAQFFVEELARGIGRIAAAFYPKEVIVRFSDFKSNEYANLLGGFLFEPEESNPMIGWRGASRYYDPRFKEAFGLECKAIKKVREEFGLTNVKVMIPFCRTPEEGKKVLEVMREFGLRRENGLEVYVMCEIPSNVILAEEFAAIFDGFSIGSNDLTQLALGLDRDSELVAHIYDERNEAVKRLIAHMIRVAKQKGKKIGICGQAPSDYEDFAEFLVECGIDSISLNPDAVLKTKLRIAEKEGRFRISDGSVPA